MEIKTKYKLDDLELLTILTYMSTDNKFLSWELGAGKLKNVQESSKQAISSRFFNSKRIGGGLAELVAERESEIKKSLELRETSKLKNQDKEFVKKCTDSYITSSMSKEELTENLNSELAGITDKKERLTFKMKIAKELGVLSTNTDDVSDKVVLYLPKRSK